MNLNLLLEMLTYCRPANSTTCERFIETFIAPLGAEPDTFGNWHVVIPNADGSPSRVLWSCHTDTVHYLHGRQTVHYSHATGVVKLSKRSKYNDRRNCLGADDTAGVYLCMQLIAAKVPGHYVFHYAEECGGIGSTDLAQYAPELLRDVDIAIALDRRGVGDVITHQYGRRCASDLFALSLAMELNRIDPSFHYDLSHGVYTDTAEYADFIAECCNLSVGYAHEHTSDECLSTRHLFKLEAALIALDHDTLFVERIPEPEPVYVPHGTTSRILSWPSVSRRYEEWSPVDDQNDIPPIVNDDPTDYPGIYLSQIYADVQKALSRRECDDCGALTYGDELHECPYYGMMR